MGETAEVAGVVAPWYGPRHGKDELVSFFQAIAMTGPVTEFTPLAFAGNDDGDVMVFIRYAFTVTATGRHVTMNMHHYWKFRDRKACTWPTALAFTVGEGFRVHGILLMARDQWPYPPGRITALPGGQEVRTMPGSSGASPPGTFRLVSNTPRGGYPDPEYIIEQWRQRCAGQFFVP